MSTTGLVFDERYRQHDTGYAHPECAERCEAILATFSACGLLGALARVAPRDASDEDLLLCHEPHYLSQVRREIAEGRAQLTGGDTPLSAATFDTARLAAGGALAAVDAVVEGGLQHVFCLLRPPGHHAEPARGMGFCVFNNVALAARYAQRVHGLERVAIVDWDVHHGNGTQAAFWKDPTVLFFSTHQSPWYPGTGSGREKGAGPGLGTTINCPFPAGAGRAEILGAFERVLRPALESFEPQLILVSAGFDSRRDDPLGGFELDDEDFADLTRVLLNVAEQHAKGRIVSILEGGYNLRGLGLAATAHVDALLRG